MTGMNGTVPRDDARFEVASAWRLRLETDPSLELSPEFQSWIADAENLRAFAGVEMAWAASRDFAVEPEILDMRQAALRRARNAKTARWTRAPLLHRLAAAVALIAALGTGALYYVATAPSVYATDVGERRMVALPDGSHISMDSDTRVSVRYVKTARQLVLEKGRAHFDVAHDVTRPFTVTAGNETVVAVGTSFDVEKIGDKVLVTLIQGRVVVKNGEAPTGIASFAPKPVSLKAGEELVASVHVKPDVRPANLQVASAWETGRLIFNGETLGEAVARVNRYTSQPVSVDPAIASIRIIGAFNAGDVSAFVSAVTSYFPVQATTTADNTILLQPRS